MRSIGVCAVNISRRVEPRVRPITPPGMVRPSQIVSTIVNDATDGRDPIRSETTPETTMAHRITAVLAIGLLGFAVAPLDFAGAVDMNPNSTPYPAEPATKPKPAPQPSTTDKDKDTNKPKDNTSQPKPKGQTELNLEGYKLAHTLIYKKHKYAAGITKLKSMRQDDNPEVANLIGYSSRKLGRYDDAKYWYEKALAADPNHARTWSYYGMWHAEQGNLLKARDYLAKVRSICGTACREYAELKGVIEGTRLY
jgi:hypothetical protein